eukprot:2701484-Rhodomonas_salina.1
METCQGCRGPRRPAEARGRGAAAPHLEPPPTPASNLLLHHTVTDMQRPNVHALRCDATDTSICSAAPPVRRGVSQSQRLSTSAHTSAESTRPPLSH